MMKCRNRYRLWNVAPAEMEDRRDPKTETRPSATSVRMRPIACRSCAYRIGPSFFCWLHYVCTYSDPKPNTDMMLKRCNNKPKLRERQSKEIRKLPVSSYPSPYSGISQGEKLHHKNSNHQQDCLVEWDVHCLVVWGYAADWKAMKAFTVTVATQHLAQKWTQKKSHP